MIDLLNYLVKNGYAATLENARIICEDDEIYPDFFTDDGQFIAGFDYIDSAIFKHQHELQKLEDAAEEETI